MDALTLEDARELLLDLLADFKFPSEADKSRALAAVITPGLVFGGLLRGRAPVDLGEADDSQAGKGYRNKLTAAIYRHSVSTIVQRKGGVGSLDESFNSALVRGEPFIAIDNVRGKVDSQAIESFLTEDRYSARVPYAAAVEIDPRRTIVMLTSNSAEIITDLANRCSCARILKQPPGFQFRQFAEGDLLDHVRQHHGRYLGAVFTLVRAWHAAGKPHTAETRHDFRAWVQPLDWIVQNLLGCAPLIEGHRETQRRMTSPALSWLRDVGLAVVRAQRTNACLRAHDLLDIIAADGTVEIPGVDGEGMVVDDDKTREKAMRAIGTRMAQFFRDDEQIDIDGYTIERQCTTDQSSREVRSYRFFRAKPPNTPACAPHRPPHENTETPHAPHGSRTFCTQSEVPQNKVVRDHAGHAGECGGGVQEDITQPTVWNQEITL